MDFHNQKIQHYQNQSHAFEKKNCFDLFLLQIVQKYTTLKQYSYVYNTNEVISRWY